MTDWRSLIGIPQHADCLDLMRQLPDGVIDLAILDPPFNLNFDDYGGKTDDNKPMTEYRWWLKRCTTEAERVLKPGRLLFLWQAMRHCLEVWQDYPQARLFAACKNFVQIRKVDVQYALDPVLFWHNGESEKLFADGKGPSGSRRDWIVGNHCKERAKGIGQWHPCPRPESHVEYIVSQWSNEGNLILDPFGGSFTTMRVAHRLNRRCISGDICAEYVERAMAELKQPQQLEFTAARTL